MKATKRINVEVLSKKLMQTISTVQYVTGLQIVMSVKDFDIPEGTTAKVFFKKPSGKFVYQSGTISGNDIIIDVENQSLAEYGYVYYQVRLTNGDDIITTFSGKIDVEKSLADNSATSSETIVPAFDSAVQKAVTEIESARDSAVQYIGNGLDDTLSTKGKAADAAATGKAVDELKGDINDISNVVFEYGDKYNIEFGIIDYNGYIDENATVQITPGAGMVMRSLLSGTESFLGKLCNIKGSVSSRSSYAVCFFADTERTQFLGGVSVSNQTTVDKNVIIPKDTRCILRSGSCEIYEINNIRDYVDKEISENSVVKIKQTTNLFDKEKVTLGLELATYGYSENSDTFVSELIAVEPNTLYTLSNDLSLVSCRYKLYDENKKELAFVNTSSEGRTEFTTPETCTFMKFSAYKSGLDGKLQLNKGNALPYVEFKNYSIDGLVVETNENNWEGYKWLVYGDSISSYAWFTTTARLTGLSICRGAIGGTCASGDSETGLSGCSSERINGVYNNNPNIDVITVMFGANDWSQNKPIGTLPDRISTDTEFDCSTFIGAMATIVKKFQTLYPNAIIVLLTPTFRVGNYDATPQYEPFQNGNSIIDFGNATKEVARRFGCPILDMYNECGINIYNYKTYLSDLVHPNENGMNRIAQVVAGKLNNLIPYTENN